VTTSPILAIRHGSAGSRAKWSGDDRLRPLDDVGIRQAAWLAGELAGGRPPRLLSSPFVRCVQTLVPLAQALGLEIEERPELAEGASGASVVELAATLARQAPGSLLCSHGDMLGKLIGEHRRCAKGSVWAMDWRDGVLVPTHYLKPPV
jgi:8-oxo-dGTP diphosphatase